MKKFLFFLFLSLFSLLLISCSPGGGGSSSSGESSTTSSSSDDDTSTDDGTSTTGDGNTSTTSATACPTSSTYSVDNSTVDNSSTISDNSLISDNSTIKNSKVKQCSSIVSSTIDNSTISDNSTIRFSTIDNSTIQDNSTISDNSTIKHSTITFSSSCYSTITSSTINNSTVCNSTIDNSSISNSTIDNRTIQNQTITETVAPSVSSTSPADTDTSVNNATNITVTFSEIMDSTSITTNTDNTSCTGSFHISSDNFTSCIKMTTSSPYTSDNKSFTIDPSDNLSSETTYKIRITTEVKDPSGNSMSSLYETATGFTTQDNAPPTAPNVTGSTPTNDTTPTWSWSTGGGGNGTYRYKRDSSDLSSGATQTSSTSYTPGSALSEGSYTLYVQERDAAGNWSSSGSSTIVIDTTAPTISSFTSTSADGSYDDGSSVNITATASESIVSDNTITVILNNSVSEELTAPDNGTTLVGTYTVSTNDTPTCVLSVSSFSIGTVTDIAGNAMTNTTVPSNNNINTDSDIVIIGTGC